MIQCVLAGAAYIADSKAECARTALKLTLLITGMFWMIVFHCANIAVNLLRRELPACVFALAPMKLSPDGVMPLR